MNTTTVQILLGFLWLLGCIFGVMVRATGWLAKQPPETATLANWWRLARWRNIQSLLIGILGVGIWCDGTLFKYLGLDAAGLILTFGLTFVAGAVVTYCARSIIGKLNATAADKTGTAPDNQED